MISQDTFEREGIRNEDAQTRSLNTSCLPLAFFDAHRRLPSVRPSNRSLLQEELENIGLLETPRRVAVRDHFAKIGSSINPMNNSEASVKPEAITCNIS